MEYTFKQFIEDLEAITSASLDHDVITRRAAPFLAKLCANPEAIPAEYRTAPAGQRGRYILHRGPRFNVTSVIWRPGDEARSHDHETWGLVGVVENEIQETRYVSRGARSLGDKVALEVREVLRHKAGAVSRLVPPHDEIHAMHNPTTKDMLQGAIGHPHPGPLLGSERETFEPSPQEGERAAVRAERQSREARAELVRGS